MIERVFDGGVGDGLWVEERLADGGRRLRMWEPDACERCGERLRPGEYRRGWRHCACELSGGVEHGGHPTWWHMACGATMVWRACTGKPDEYSVGE